jgi:spore maturation protein B
MTFSALCEPFGNALILLFLVGIPLYGFFKKVPVYDTFVEGAKEGIPTFVRLVPYMVAMLVAVGMLRASGAFDLLNHVLAPWLKTLGIPPEIVPIVLVRPFSGSATTAALADLLHQQGGNAFISHLATVVAGTTETTFYVIAVYFGAANIKNIRHALPTSLVVDVVGILSAIWITQWVL